MQGDPPKGTSAPSPLAAPEPWDLVADAYTAELLPIFVRFTTAVP